MSCGVLPTKNTLSLITWFNFNFMINNLFIIYWALKHKICNLINYRQCKPWSQMMLHLHLHVVYKLIPINWELAGNNQYIVHNPKQWLQAALGRSYWKWWNDENNFKICWNGIVLSSSLKITFSLKFFCDEAYDINEFFHHLGFIHRSTIEAY